MFVRARARRYVDHRAAFRDCLPTLGWFVALMSMVGSVAVAIYLTPGMYLAEVHTRMPALLASMGIAAAAQLAAIAVRYRDHLARQRRRAEAELRGCCGCEGGCAVPAVFDLPRARHRAL